MWEAEHGPGTVVGLAPSAKAAQVLAADLGIVTDNTAQWLTQQHLQLGRRDRITTMTARREQAARAGRGSTHPGRRAGCRPGAEYDRWRLRPGQLLIVDEAGMAGTFALAALAEQAKLAGAKLLLVGDPYQLSAVETGGAFGLLTAARADAPRCRWCAGSSTRTAPAGPGATTADPAIVARREADRRINGIDVDIPYAGGDPGPEEHPSMLALNIAYPDLAAAAGPETGGFLYNTAYLDGAAAAFAELAVTEHPDLIGGNQAPVAAARSGSAAEDLAAAEAAITLLRENRDRHGYTDEDAATAARAARVPGRGEGLGRCHPNDADGPAVAVGGRPAPGPGAPAPWLRRHRHPGCRVRRRHDHRAAHRAHRRTNRL